MEEPGLFPPCVGKHCGGGGRCSPACTWAPGGLGQIPEAPYSQQAQPRAQLGDAVGSSCRRVGGRVGSGLRRICRRSPPHGPNSRAAQALLLEHSLTGQSHLRCGGTIHPSLGKAVSENQARVLPTDVVGGPCPGLLPPDQVPGRTLPAAAISGPSGSPGRVDGHCISMVTGCGEGPLTARRALESPGEPRPQGTSVRDYWAANTWLRGSQGTGLTPPPPPPHPSPHLGGTSLTAGTSLPSLPPPHGPLNTSGVSARAPQAGLCAPTPPK